MSKEVQKKKIGNHEYSCVMMNTERSLRLLPKIVKYLGPALIELWSHWGASAEQQIQAGKSLVSFVGEKLDNDEFFSIFKELVLECGKDDTRMTNISLDFQNGIVEPIQVFVFVLQVNYSLLASFFNMSDDKKKQ